MASQTCRFCGQKLGLLERWRYQHYCSVECKGHFEQENARLAVEWLSELNRTKKPPPPPPPSKESHKGEHKEEMPEPSQPGFVAQPEPVGNDLTIHAAGFPPAKPCLKPFKRKEESAGGGDKVPSRIAMANEMKRVERALWMNAPKDEAEPCADAYRIDGRLAVYPPESPKEEAPLSLPGAWCVALEVRSEARGSLPVPLPFGAESFDWKFSSEKPARVVAFPDPALKSDCCALDASIAPPAAAGVKCPELVMEWAAGEVKQPVLAVGLAAIDFRDVKPKAAERSAPIKSGEARPAVTIAAQPYPMPMYAAYPAPVYPVAYPMMSVPAQTAPVANSLIHALMSATSAYAGPAPGGTAYDTSPLTSLLPALLASGWLRIEPDFAQLIHQEPELPVDEGPGTKPPVLDVFAAESKAITPRLAVECERGFPQPPSLDLDQWIQDAECPPRGFEGAAPAAIESVRPARHVTFAAGCSATPLAPIEVVSYEPDTAPLAIATEPIQQEVKPQNPVALMQPSRPGWKARRFDVHMAVRPLDLSFLDIPMEAGPWARE